jgi:tRNA (guanine37-N1)-methyltransferase
MLRIDVITIFPNVFEGYFGESILKRAQDQKAVEIRLIELRDFTDDAHRTVDDRPFGGGAGMVMKPEPLFRAVASLRQANSHVILTSPGGSTFNQARATELTSKEHLIFICGHYEGVDDRVRSGIVDEELSIGDYVLTNGNLPAMVMTDAIVRLLPGVLGSSESIVEESFSEPLLEYPHFTRPRVFNGVEVPEVLLSGDHKKIADWRRQQSIERTRRNRPDLLQPNNNGEKS